MVALLLPTAASGQPAAPSEQVGGAGVVPGAEFARVLEGNRIPDLSNMTIEGNVDLRGLNTVGRPLRCLSCRFTGELDATDVIFERIVDISGSTFEDAARFTAAVFRDRAGFEGVTFAGEASFASTRFTADASFAEAVFNGDARFGRSQFAGLAAFSDAVFSSSAGFSGARFGSGADFSGAGFSGDADFSASGFGERVSFARADFDRLAEFRGVSLAGGANMGVERFGAGFDMGSVTAGERVQFLGAALHGEGVLTNFSSSGTLSLDGLRAVGPNSNLFLDGLSVSRLTMDVERIGMVRGSNVRKEVLRLVEESGRQSGDLALANRARFELLDLEGSEKDGIARLLDRLFFRDIAGYLVRPLHPLASLFLLIAIAGVVRSSRSLRAAASRWGESRAGGHSLLSRAHRAMLLTGDAIERILDGISASVRVAFRRKADHIKHEDSDRIRDHLVVWGLWTEFLAYKVLIAVFLLALGNSNSTVRQLLDAVTG